MYLELWIRGPLICLWGYVWFHINFSSWMCSHLLSFLLFEGAILNGPSPIFLEHWGTPQLKHLIRTSLAKLKQMCCTAPTFSVYIHESWTFSKTIWDKTEVLLGMSWGTNLGTWGTPWTHIGNKGEKKPPFCPNNEKTGPLMTACWAFHWLHETFISKTVSHRLWPRLMAGAQIGPLLWTLSTIQLL
jgi:hypothetical protein